MLYCVFMRDVIAVNYTQMKYFFLNLFLKSGLFLVVTCPCDEVMASTAMDKMSVISDYFKWNPRRFVGVYI